MARFYIRENSKASCNSCGSTLINFELKDSTPKQLQNITQSQFPWIRAKFNILQGSIIGDANGKR